MAVKVASSKTQIQFQFELSLAHLSPSLFSNLIAYVKLNYLVEVQCQASDWYVANLPNNELYVTISQTIIRNQTLPIMVF